MNACQKSAARQQGATLIEVLVAVVVLSIGLLGLGVLQGISLRGNTNAYLRTQATNVSYEIIDRMRANRMQIRFRGGYSSQQLGDWEAQVGAALPGGLLEITDPAGGSWQCSPANCESALVRVRWTDKTKGEGQIAAGYDTTATGGQWFETETKI